MSTQRATSWSLTLNNPTSADEECINLARQKGWKVEGQLEKGENGTPHYQLLVQTPQVRFSAVKKMFPRAHIEVARNVAALKEYVHKEKTREGELPTQQEKYPSLSKFWIMVTQYWTACEKDRLDVGELPHRVVFYRSGEEPDAECLHMMLKEAINHYIALGYHVESFYSPPNISIFKNFGISIIRRSLDEINTQTDRQTDIAEEIEEVNVPVYHTPDALCSPSSSQSPSSCSQDVSPSPSLHSQGDAPHP